MLFLISSVNAMVLGTRMLLLTLVASELFLALQGARGTRKSFRNFVTPINITAAGPTVDDLIKDGLLRHDQRDQALDIVAVVPRFAELLAACSALPEHRAVARSVVIDDLKLFDEGEQSTVDEVLQEVADRDGDIFYDAQETWDDPNDSLLVGSSLVEGSRQDSPVPSDCAELAERQEGVNVLLSTGDLVVDGVLTPSEFLEEVGNVTITACKRDELAQLRQMADFVRTDDSCVFDFIQRESTDPESIEQCLHDTERKHISALANKINFRYEDLPRGNCKCPDGKAVVGKNLLDEVILEEKIRRSPFMMREAAWLYCEGEGRRTNKSLGATYHKGCAAGSRGYCCTNFGTTSGVSLARERKDKYMLKSLVASGEIVKGIILGVDQLFPIVKSVIVADFVASHYKLIIYKMYVAHQYHSQLVLKKHRYCIQHADDFYICEDPIIMSSVMLSASIRLKMTRKLLYDLASCLISGTSSLETVVTLSGVWGPLRVLYSVVVRTAYYISSGQLARQVTRMAALMGKTVWAYRFELVMAAVVTAGAEPLMEALTSTGATAGEARDWSLVFEEFMRDVVVHLACPILKSPLLIGMMIRWTMAKIVLSEVFLKNVMRSFLMVISVANPTLLTKASIPTALSMLKSIAAILDLKQGNETVNLRKTWLDTAREFHNHLLADFLYVFFSVWLGNFWRSIASAVCVTPNVDPPVVNVTEAAEGVRWSLKFRTAIVREVKLAFKLMAEQPWDFGQEVDNTPEANVDILGVQHLWSLSSKALRTAHFALSQIANVGTEKLEVHSNTIYYVVLQKLASCTAFTTALSYIMGHFFTKFMMPQIRYPSVGSDNTLLLALEASRIEFNERTCEGKPMWSDCLYLVKSNTSSDEVLMGVCCYNACQDSRDVCIQPDEAQAAAMKEFDPQSLPLRDMEKQSGYLDGFIRKQLDVFSNCRVRERRPRKNRVPSRLQSSASSSASGQQESRSGRIVEHNNSHDDRAMLNSLHTLGPRSNSFGGATGDEED